MLFGILFADFQILMMIHLKTVEETLALLLYFDDVLLIYIGYSARVNEENPVQFYLIIAEKSF